MRLLIYIEPTSYLMPLWREIKGRSGVETRIVFLEENLSQPWDLDLQDVPNVEILHGSRAVKMMRLLWLIGQGNVNMVDLAGWGHPLLMVALLFAWIRRIPVTIESDTQFDSTTAAWRRALKCLLLPVMFRIPKRFFPAGTRQATYFMRYGVKQDRISIAQMTVDVRYIMEQVDVCREKTASSGNRPVTFLYVGRLEAYKGIQDLLDAFVDLIRQGEKGRLVIVGDGGLRGLVDSVVLTHPEVEYLGRLSGEALIHAYNSANVFVLPSRTESWGLAVNEAMAASLPVIATDRVGCVDDLVHEGKNGRVVSGANPRCLAEAMRTFIHQPEIAVTMGQASRQIISSWTIEDEAKILMTAWDELK